MDSLMDGLKDGGREGRREGGREGGTDGVSEGLASAEDAGRRPSGAGAFRRYTQCPWVGSGVRVRYLAPALSRPALSRAASTVSFRTFVHRALCDRMRGVARLVAPARPTGHFIRVAEKADVLRVAEGVGRRQAQAQVPGRAADFLSESSGSREAPTVLRRRLLSANLLYCQWPGRLLYCQWPGRLLYCQWPPSSLLSMAGPCLRPTSSTVDGRAVGAPAPSPLSRLRLGGGPPTVSWHAVPTVWPGRLRLPSARFPLLSLSGPRGRVAARPPTV